MISVTPFSSLIGAYPIMEHTVQFNPFAEEWQRLFERHPELREIFLSIQTPEGNYRAVIVNSNVLKAIPNISEMKNCPFDHSPELYNKQIGYINRISNRLGLDSPDKLGYFLLNCGKSIKINI